MSILHESRPTYAFIDLDRFERNVDVIARSLPPGARLVAVLKGDGYGHGAMELAKRLRADRVAMIAVSLLEEALELRRAGIDLSLLVLGPITREQMMIALDNRITFGVIGPEELEDVCAVARERDVTIHLKLDSGMGRMGVVESELWRVIEMIRATPRLRIEAIYTHFANADDAADPFTEIQIANYDRMLAVLREAGIDAPLHHFANSAATLRGLVRPGDFARVGIALYGPEPIKIATGTIEPILRWRTEIMRLKELPAGHAIGYGTTFHTTRPSRIATLPVGYADGYDRLLSNNAEVLIREQRAPVVGRVSMDLVTIDVTDVPNAALGDEVILLGDSITAEELARRSQTISYEVFCRISARVPRVYPEGGAFRIRSRFAE
ncbi:MAG TPA: alanine racemase [Thermoanaerobaculia bacterium]|jgi:alanine racemase|nr:alanine racemase [Thermoanaerobaculia bacterium]